MDRGLTYNLNDPALFEKRQQGRYEYYSKSDSSKCACGYLYLSDEPKRDASAQASAGGESRRDAENAYGADDGGHIIGARFGGSTEDENLVAQNRNFNRSRYKKIENNWEKHIENGDKVYVNLEFSGGERPDYCDGYAIIESPDGRRDVEYYSLYNESRQEQDKWEEDFEQYTATEEYTKFEAEDAEKYGEGVETSSDYDLDTKSNTYTVSGQYEEDYSTSGTAASCYSAESYVGTESSENAENYYGAESYGDESYSPSEETAEICTGSTASLSSESESHDYSSSYD